MKHGRRYVLTAVMLTAVVAVGDGCRTKKPGTSDLGKTDWTTVDDTASTKRDDFGGDEKYRIKDVQFENVLFAFDSYQIQSGEVSKIEKVAEYLRKNPTVRLVTEGNCDERGSTEYNLSLGEHRALAVRAHLVGTGIASDRIQTRSFGEEKPVDPGHDESAWRQNRRVEFALYSQ